ncbi:MAG: sugar ABC transporter ATP-binding protein [Christensenellales bacterium]
MNNYILEMRGITKIFPGVKALDNVNFKVKKGEIHGLLGENGAGKSTLMKVLSGVYPYRSYDGEISLDNETQRFNQISDSEKAGIAIIYQELALIPELTVYENIFFGHEIKNGAFIDWNETFKRAVGMLKKVRLNINPAIKVKELGIGTRQLIEIAKAISKNVKLLILDEPTAALNEDDSINLLNLLRELKEQGVTSILISHKIKEVLSIADTITVLRDGKTVCTLDPKDRDFNEFGIIKHMVGREIENIYPPRLEQKIGDVCFEVRNWSAIDSAKGKQILHDINLNVRKGEIVSIAGLMGAGRTEFALSLFGNTDKYAVQGEMYINGKKQKFKHPRQAIDAGLAYATEDRKNKGLILIQNIKQNISIANLKSLCNMGVINENREIRATESYIESLNIKATSVAQITENLSGGNQQKVSVAKWLYANPQIMILDEPTRGIDVGAKYEIYCIMRDLVRKGMSIIMISSELLEILGISDRIYVMNKGRITGEIMTSEATQETIMQKAML